MSIITFKEVNNYYKEKYGKNISVSTMNRWVKEGKVKAEKLQSGKYNYDFESFKNTIESPEYIKKAIATRHKPTDYIGQRHEDLLITGIVPKEEKKMITKVHICIATV